MSIFQKLLKSRIARNAGWLMLGRILHIILNFVVGLLTARYLGPSNYGIINYAAAYCTFFTSLCTLGVHSVIVKNLVDYPEEEGETVGTVIVLRLVSATLSMITIIGIVSVIDRGDPLSVTVTALYSFSLVFQIFDTFSFWMQAKLLSKYYAISTFISFSAACAYKVVLLILDMDVTWFAVSNSVDYFLLALLLFIFYKKNHGQKFSFSIRKSKQILSVSCSYILSGLMVSIYAVTDRLMLKQMMDDASVGYYSLAVQISTLWAFVLSAIIDSMKSTIMEAHNSDKERYQTMNKQMYALVLYISFGVSLLFCLIAPLFIGIVYGDDYLPAVEPLRIVVWYVAFSYLGVARDIWIVCERKQKYIKYIYISSAAINVLLNYLLIPVWGMSGAAVASLVTQISTIFFVPLFIRPLRENTKMIFSALLLRGVLPKRKAVSKTD